MIVGTSNQLWEIVLSKLPHEAYMYGIFYGLPIIKPGLLLGVALQEQSKIILTLPKFRDSIEAKWSKVVRIQEKSHLKWFALFTEKNKLISSYFTTSNFEDGDWKNVMIKLTTSQHQEMLDYFSAIWRFKSKEPSLLPTFHHLLKNQHAQY